MDFHFVKVGLGGCERDERGFFCMPANGGRYIHEGGVEIRVITNIYFIVFGINGFSFDITTNSNFYKI